MRLPTRSPRMEATPSPARGALTVDAGRLVDRPRLAERVREGAQGPLTVLAAPAGYGKSVVLGQWAARQPSRPMARLALRPADGAARVAVRLVAALGRLGARIDPAASAGVGGDGAGLGEHFAAAVSAGLETVSDGVLVVDGLDAPTDARLVEDMRSLIGGLPDGVHVLVAQRSRWPTSQHAPDARAAAVVLDQADLAFTPDSARCLLRRVAGREVPDRQAEALLERTEGWAVALRLAAIALRGSAVPDARIEDLMSDDRYLAGYIRGEVLAAQSAAVCRFVLHTSVLDRLSGPLCDAVTGDRDGAAMLCRLEERGLFTQRVGGEEGWYRYHPLFRAALRHELRRREPDAEAGLLIRAAGWHLGRDEPGPASRYVIETGDEAHLIDLIDRYGRVKFERGEADEVLGWLDALPGSRDPRRADLAMRRAFLHTMLGNTRLAYQVVHELDAAGLSVGEGIAVDALRATWAFADASPASAIHAADAVLGAVDDVDPDDIPDVFGLTSPSSLRMMAAGSRARALWYVGDIAASRRALSELARQGDAYPPWLVHAASALAMLEAWAGNFRVAERHAGRALDIAAAARLLNHPATIDARLAAAHVARERGALARADVLLAEAHRLATCTSRPVTLALLGVERALWFLAAGRPERGLGELERNRSSGDPPPPPLLEAHRRAGEVRLLLAVGDVERAWAVLDEPTVAGAPLPGLGAVPVQVAVARGDVESARAHLDGWHPGDDDPRARLEHELWAAVLDAEAGERRLARERTATLVAEAQTEGHLRLFRDAGRPAERLLRDLRHGSAPPTPYLRRLVDAAQSTQRAAIGGAAVGLSERELEIVRYVPTPLSNAEIAARLYISVNTVKTHMRAIYRKLGVTGRSEAIRRAEDLGIA